MRRVEVVSYCACGYATKPSTPAAAAYSFGRHSCDTHRERVARRQRRLDRLALSGPEAPCTHRTHHQHGTYVCYVADRCRCRPCRDANNAAERARNRQHMYGHPSYVDAAPARAHIAALTAAGMGLKRIVAVTDISQGLLSKLIYGDQGRNMAPSKRIRAATETAILAITLNLADGARIDSKGTTRRIQALVAIGWSQSQLAARLGILRSNFTPLAQGRTDVTVAHAKAVEALYEQLWDQVPEHAEWRAHIAYTRALNYAAAAGWVVPMAWSEETIDDPSVRRPRRSRRTAIAQLAAAS